MTERVGQDDTDSEIRSVSCDVVVDNVLLDGG